MPEQIIPPKLMPEFRTWMQTDPKAIDGLSYHETFMKLRENNQNQPQPTTNYINNNIFGDYYNRYHTITKWNM